MANPFPKRKSKKHSNPSIWTMAGTHEKMGTFHKRVLALRVLGNNDKILVDDDPVDATNEFLQILGTQRLEELIKAGHGKCNIKTKKARKKPARKPAVKKPVAK